MKKSWWNLSVCLRSYLLILIVTRACYRSSNAPLESTSFQTIMWHAMMSIKEPKFILRASPTIWSRCSAFICSISRSRHLNCFLGAFTGLSLTTLRREKSTCEEYRMLSQHSLSASSTRHWNYKRERTSVPTSFKSLSQMITSELASPKTITTTSLTKKMIPIRSSFRD